MLINNWGLRREHDDKQLGTQWEYVEYVDKQLGTQWGVDKQLGKYVDKQLGTQWGIC